MENVNMLLTALYVHSKKRVTAIDIIKPDWLFHTDRYVEHLVRLGLVKKHTGRVTSYESTDALDQYVLNVVHRAKEYLDNHKIALKLKHVAK